VGVRADFLSAPGVEHHPRLVGSRLDPFDHDRCRYADEMCFEDRLILLGRSLVRGRSVVLDEVASVPCVTARYCVHAFGGSPASDRPRCQASDRRAVGRRGTRLGKAPHRAGLSLVTKPQAEAARFHRGAPEADVPEALASGVASRVVEVEGVERPATIRDLCAPGASTGKRIGSTKPNGSCRGRLRRTCHADGRGFESLHPLQGKARYGAFVFSRETRQERLANNLATLAAGAKALSA
jgi:hypothetical protein